MNRLLYWIALASSCWYLAGCAALPTSVPDVQASYHAAIADAAVASPSKIMPLQPLPSGDTVTVVSWVVAQRVPCAAADLPCSMTVGKEPLWVTLAGEVQAACRSWQLQGDALRRRLEQLLGLPMDPPPQYRKAMFVELQVPRSRLQRPCLGLDESDPRAPVCTLQAQASTSQELRNFVGQQMAGSYVVNNPQGPGYPFTRLGYTYDWGPNARPNHYGVSEFLVAPASTLRAVRVLATDAYCTEP